MKEGSGGQRNRSPIKEAPDRSRLLGSLLCQGTLVVQFSTLLPLRVTAMTSACRASFVFQIRAQQVNHILPLWIRSSKTKERPSVLFFLSMRRSGLPVVIAKLTNGYAEED
jgi:hypothetical protein